jgi:hypothetical protein
VERWQISWTTSPLLSDEGRITTLNGNALHAGFHQHLDMRSDSVFGFIVQRRIDFVEFD